MQHKIWKVSFVVALCATLYWFYETIFEGARLWDHAAGADNIAGMVCILIGMFTVPVMALITAYLARQAFRDVKGSE